MYTNMADDAELSQEQTVKIVQFQEVTGTEDVSMARSMLEQRDWNLESAVQDHLALQDSPPPTPPQPQAHPHPHPHLHPLPQVQPTVNGTANNMHIDAQQPRSFWNLLPSRPQGGTISWIFYFLTLPLFVAFTSLSSPLRFLYSIIYPSPRRSDPLGDVLSFVSEFEGSYGIEHPAFFQGSYTQALAHAKSALKFLLVYLHCGDHQDTPEFCRNTLSNAALLEYINNNLVFWACSVTTPEGYRVSQALRENAYPFLAMIVLRDGRMTAVAKLEGPCTADSLITRLQSIVRENEAYLVVARADRQEREQTAALRQEQDEAYLESLRADQAKERKKKQEREELERQEEEERRAREEVQKQKENIRKLKVEMADEIPEEPEEGQAGVVQIMAKLPDGKRLERRFLETHSLKCLYYYIFCHPDSPDRFQVTTNFPRQVVPCEPTADNPVPPTFKQFKLPSRSMLFVTDLDA
ncbi:FAS-associated factor 2-like [Oratosquilla oratoria]|uniref:FAS-associated factor 2-like n=1 Tax=Oratosquilla oratoria TaxID=337810 RepID=UPI003F76724B